MYSLVSAALVGLSGIFPLVVIPIEAGEALRKGAAANCKLKLLLSFAVGGLLGDVFLHLLPEAWAHLDKLGGAHRGNIVIGCWVLTGLLSFMIIEKLFPENSDDDENDENEDDDDEDDEDEENTENSACEWSHSQQQQQQHHAGRLDCATTTRHRHQQTNSVTHELSTLHNNTLVHNGFTSQFNGHTKNTLMHVANGKPANGLVELTENGKPAKNGLVKPVQSNGCLLNGVSKVQGTGRQLNGAAHNGVKSTGAVTSVAPCIPAAVHHIKTSGWLNLMANIIDNFTHGLAVAGSFNVSLKTGLITTFAILLHEVPHEIGDFAILLRAGFDRWKAAKAQLLTATGGILGAVAALSAESTELAGDRTAWILPFTSGGFLYIALVTVLPDLLHDHSNPLQTVKQLLLLCAGIGIMASITIFVD